MNLKRGMAYAAAIAGGAAVGVLWGGAYFGPEVRAAMGAGVGWLFASLWFESLDKASRAVAAQRRQADQFERDIRP